MRSNDLGFGLFSTIAMTLHCGDGGSDSLRVLACCFTKPHNYMPVGEPLIYGARIYAPVRSSIIARSVITLLAIRSSNSDEFYSPP